MLKVCALLPDYIDKPMGGLGVQFMKLYPYLKEKVEYYIVGYPEKPKVDNFKSNLTPFERFEYPSINNIYHQLLYYHNALEYKVNFDIIHCFDWSTALAGVYLSRHFNKPLVYGMNLSSKHLNEVGTFFCSDIRTIDGAFLNYYMICAEELGLKYANVITHVSEFYKNLYPEHEYKSEIILNGLDVKEWVPKRPVRFPGKNKIKVCYIGRACDMKGIDMIADCIIPDNIDFYFIAAKKGAEGRVWEQIKSKVNNKNVFHIKGLFGQDKIDFLCATDAVVMPSKHEPAGIVAMEALISKNLLITTATGGIAETVKDVEYLECHNSAELQECLESLSRLSEEDLERLKSSGYNKMLQRDWSNSANQLIELYDRIKGEGSMPDRGKSLEQTMKEIEYYSNIEGNFFTS